MKRSFVLSGLLAVATSAVVLTSAQGASAANCVPAKSKSGITGYAWCSSGSNYIKVRLKCLDQRTDLITTHDGPRIWSAGSSQQSVKSCPSSNYVIDSYSAIVG
ncbi:hypothetical protein Rhe02_62620 [Rhizocola hellebori]|uniref:Uncharacterized protein n=1 Tax=Rhizocola hellebori TaxID=1392758 RepID=A0A8J3QEM3_9ACTN|nr:hypothetical protein [Rhizocola hellebori]GIH08195.1 hypothetical protein Rhe02_62620 [Rhizocola hellebori]